MNRPGLRTLLLGSRLTAPPIILGSAWYTWKWWQAGGPDNTGLIAIALMVFSAKAANEVAAHRQWRRDWQAMAPGGGTPQSRWWRHLPRVLAILVIGVLTLWLGRPDATPQQHHAQALMIGGGLIVAIAIIALRLLRHVRWPHIRRGSASVTLAIGGPVLPVPNLATCYRRLPPYCQQLLKGRSS